VDPEEDSSWLLTPAESFRRAKAQFYLDRAEEFLNMARYFSAEKELEKVRRVDPENESCKAFEEAIQGQLSKIRSTSGGISDNGKKHEIVLVVDQDERLLSSLAESLQRYGFQMVGAASLEEALETMASIKPSVVISEVNFESGPRGFDLYLWMKTNNGCHDIPFLFLAARLDRDMLIAGKRFGVDDFILKPVDDEVVSASIMNCLSKRRIPAERS
jgi:PleD family two-component response regulator